MRKGGVVCDAREPRCPELGARSGAREKSGPRLYGVIVDDEVVHVHGAAHEG
jgi:hypothetical protein